MIASLALPLFARLKHSVDILLFNPPYVPTVIAEAENAQGTADIEGSWAGGIDGMHVTDIFLQTVEVRSSWHKSLAFLDAWSPHY
jgi:release factor glutamine methyltransferase